MTILEPDAVDPAVSLELESPLIERTEGRALPGVVSLDRARTCNDTVVLAALPLRLRMPRRQWSYGLLLPLDQAAVPATGPITVVRLELTVHSGVVGLAGVCADLTTLTTPERSIAPGTATVTLTLEGTAATAAIFLRTVSEGDCAPEVTLRRASAHLPGASRLAPRRHDLGHDLFAVISSGKTATQTIARTLLSLDPSVQVRRTHVISSQVSARARASEPSKALLGQMDYADHLRREIALVRALGGRVALISGKRDPVDQIVSGVFQSIPLLVPGFARLRAAGRGLLATLAEYAIHKLRRELERGDDSAWPRIRSFFDEELTPIAGMDALREPIDRKAGFSLMTGSNTSVLLYRYEDIAKMLPSALFALTERRGIRLVTENMSADKDYADLYHEFRASFRVPADLCAAIYDSDPYLRRFYLDEEIAAFKARWSA
jgi:Putative capsular polysaccharide synthesis protein